MNLLTLLPSLIELIKSFRAKKPEVAPIVEPTTETVVEAVPETTTPNEAATIKAKSKRILLYFVIALVSADYIVEPLYNHFATDKIDVIGIDNILNLVPVLLTIVI